MKAAVLVGYGDAAAAFAIAELPRPEPGSGQLCVKVDWTTVTAGDMELRTLSLPWLFQVPLRLWLGWSRPRANAVLGMQVAGTVAAVGEGVTRFAVGDAVFAGTGMHFGGYAEYALVDADELCAATPAGLSSAEVASLPIEGLAALGYLRAGGLAAGKEVLIRGASGSIGTYAVRIAKRAGARVTAVCGPAGLERVAELGADAVLDYTTTDFTEGGERFDLVLDVVGRVPIRRCLAVVRPGGAYVRGTVPGVVEVIAMLWRRLVGRKRVVLGDAGGTSADLELLASWLVDGTLTTVVDRRYRLADIGAAHAYVETGHKQGQVLIAVGEEMSASLGDGPG